MLFFNNIFLPQKLVKLFTILVVLLSLLPYHQKRNYYSGKFSALTSLSSTIRPVCINWPFCSAVQRYIGLFRFIKVRPVGLSENLPCRRRGFSFQNLASTVTFQTKALKRNDRCDRKTHKKISEMIRQIVET